MGLTGRLFADFYYPDAIDSCYCIYKALESAKLNVPEHTGFMEDNFKSGSDNLICVRD